jgi:hypothetical protein
MEAAMNYPRVRIGKAIANALRGLAAALRREACCPKLHFAGWR